MIDDNLRGQAKKIFLDASNYIRKYGWQVSGMSEHGKPRCSMGALESAGPKGEWDKNLSRLMYEKLYEQLNGMSLTYFNEKYRNGEKVAKLFEKTSKQI